MKLYPKLSTYQMEFLSINCILVEVLWITYV